MVYGNTEGVKAIILEELESLMGNYDRHLFIDREVLSCISYFTTMLNREICVFISRTGVLLNVGIGDNASVPLKTASTARSTRKLSGVRCIHTHPTGNSTLSDLDISALKNTRYDCMCAVGVVGGEAINMTVGYYNGQELMTEYIDVINSSIDKPLVDKIREVEASIKIDTTTAVKQATAILVGAGNSERLKEEVEELARLADTAGLDIVAVIKQKLDKPNNAYYIGVGKLEELARQVQIQDVDFVIFNSPLTGSQINNLEQKLDVSVMDRSMLILEIFARHATTNEGKIQVELARMKYTLPKLLGQGKALSRIGGGSGTATRGAGETKSETDRRHIKKTIYDLQLRINKLKEERKLRKKRRNRTGIKTVAIVGYTNAGKSTLMNRLTKANVLEEDKLFATLDPVTRKIFVDINKEYLLTDTVGFIDNLPHEFVDAFRSTLEEAIDADILLHIVDSSAPEMAKQYEVVLEVLDSLGNIEKPIITVYNKCEIIKKNFEKLDNLESSVLISARTGEGIVELKNLVNTILFGVDEPIEEYIEN